MNQGRAIQAFLKAYKFSNDPIFLGYAEKSMNTLFIPVSEGGVSYIDSSGYWFEEYADDDTPQSRVLNGMIVVLEALSEYYNVTNNPKTLYLFNNGVRAVVNTLHFYDNHGHSNYDILGKPASPWYHKFHVSQMKFLYERTKMEIFRTYQYRWQLYREPTYLISYLKKPTRIGTLTIIAVISLSYFISIFLIILLSKIKRELFKHS
jgi:hypothetical protein